MRIRNIVLFLVLAAGLAAALSAQAKFSSPAVSADEKAMAAEKRPNFASPQIEDKALKVAGLPEALTWYTSKPGIWGSTRAKQGGTYRSYIGEFPETFRTVGPNANGAYRNLFMSSPATVELNSETKEFMPSLATDWAFGADKKTVYFKLNEKAKWSDGKPVTSKDYLFMLKFMRSPNIQDPWYNDTYTTQLVDLKAYGDWVISVTANDEMAPADLLNNNSVSPRPEHFYNGDIPKDWVDQYQWKAEPTAGPYYLADFEKGESLTFKRVKDWWGYGYDYNKYRFNFDTLEYKLITGGNDVIKNYFYKAEIDQFYMIIPQLWASEAGADQVTKGYVDRHYGFFVPVQGLYGIFLNTKDPLLSSLNVRRGLYYAINIQKMIDTTLRGEYARYHNIGIGHTFTGIDYDDNTIRKPDFDPAKAAELFAKAGFDKIGSDGIRVNAKGERLTFELIYASPNHTERVSVLKEEAKKAGLDINLKLQQQGSFTALREKKFQAYWGGMSTSLVPDYWGYFHSSNADKTQTNNFFGYANPEMDKLLDAARAEGDPKKVAELDKKIQRLVDQEALVIPNYYVPYVRDAAWKWIRYPSWLTTKYYDYYPYVFTDLSTNYGDYFGYTWSDEAIRKEVLAAQKAGQVYEPRTYMDTTNKVK
jgi:microcin C transport system substrate-binding protein